VDGANKVIRSGEAWDCVWCMKKKRDEPARVKLEDANLVGVPYLGGKGKRLHLRKWGNGVSPIFSDEHERNLRLHVGEKSDGIVRGHLRRAPTFRLLTGERGGPVPGSSMWSWGAPGSGREGGASYC